MKGCWVFVCGASGAGKDSVMRWAEVHLAEQQDIVFARRMVTRPSTSDSDHDEVSVDEFDSHSARGRLAWKWHAHGFNYGIDAKYACQVAAGQIVVVNGSREHVNQLDHNEQIKVVQIEVSPADLELRLINRARETIEKISERLARNDLFTALPEHHRILNDGELADAGKAFADYLAAGCCKPSSSAK
jgi:ribose 1,5-bisphosphokinase